MKMISKRREWLFLALLLVWAVCTFIAVPVYLKSLIGAGILGVAGFLGLAILLGSGAILKWSVDPRYRQLLAHGQPATATVLACSDRGRRYSSAAGELTGVTMRLEVQPADRPPCETVVEVVVPLDAIPRVGDVIAVKYDPQDPAAVAVIAPPS
jgi:hypothetical protein